MSDAVHALLTAIASELKQQQLWSTKSPDAAAMTSTLPFCCDTLSVQQWLQFILLPRLKAMLDAGQPLPDKISVLPYAEEAFKAQGPRLQHLLRLIGRLDRALSGAA